MTIAPEILAAQQAYAARPFAVRWVDSHFSGTFRFETFDEAFDYMHQQWTLIQRTVKTTRYRESHLRQSWLETPNGRISLRWYLLCDDVSSYGAESDKL